MEVEQAIARAHRTEWARIVSGLIARTGDWMLAEDATQDAFTAALLRWPVDGVPDRPGAWLTTAARNAAVDRLRAAGTDRRREEEWGMDRSRAESSDDLADERLRLIFTCCHPALPLAGQVALTLRTVTGLPVSEIARTFLVPEPTMAQRLVRARRKIEHAGIPYRVPPDDVLGERLTGVLAVLYLAFNAGYSDPSFLETAQSAIATTEAVVDLMPRQSEPKGLLALMLFHGSRRDARRSKLGGLLTIEEQDRTLWRDHEIERAIAVLASAGERGPYVVQAEIASCHATAAHADDTNWPRIVSLYDELLAIQPSPVIELNRAVALGMAGGPNLGLAAIDDVADRLQGVHYVPAARADLLVRARRVEEAARAYAEAIELAPTDEQSEQLRRRLAAISST